MNEILWKQITEFPDYEISEYGHVRNIKTQRILKPTDNRGYWRIGLKKDKKQYSSDVHRLVAITFLPNPNNLPQVDHLDQDKKNNHVSNLRWVTRDENNKNRTKFASTGMFFNKWKNKWIAQIVSGKDLEILGEYNTMEEAYNSLRVNLD